MSAYYPEKTEFMKRAANGNMAPVYKEILADMETPVSAFKKIGSGEYSFLLESVEGGERMARYSFLGSSANMVIQSKGSEIEITREGKLEHITLVAGKDVLDVLKAEFGKLRYVPDPDLPRFCGGAVGFIGYDMVRFFEDLPDMTTDDLHMPDCTLIFTDTLLIFDHVRHRIRVVCNASIDGDAAAAYDLAIQKIDSVIEQLRQPIELSYEKRQVGKPEIASNFTKEQFEDAVRTCKEYIASGDAIQVVLSQRFSTKVTAEPFDVYRALRSLNPSPYMYYLAYGDIKLIGSSPEILVTEERGNVTIRPIAGTRPRGATHEEDLNLERELLKDEKERAEHIMLVDLGRNDIGRVCRYGSVEVDQLMSIERYSHVMHIVSNVRGRLSMDKDQFDLLRACFPAGTVSGAPKVRAMEIIDELEPTRRGSYAGAIGYFSYSGDMDTCITIRTILIQNDTAYVQAGAGIVADSDPAKEYQETVNKAMAMINALNTAEAGLE
ncbi:MAG: anthranilate synthase component I [Armatimonadetes bacterium]|nr:anthranilate synthase component I [Armatimonadota bacterium]